MLFPDELLDVDGEVDVDALMSDVECDFAMSGDDIALTRSTVPTAGASKPPAWASTRPPTSCDGISSAVDDHRDAPGVGDPDTDRVPEEDGGSPLDDEDDVNDHARIDRPSSMANDDGIADGELSCCESCVARQISIMYIKATAKP